MFLKIIRSTARVALGASLGLLAALLAATAFLDLPREAAAPSALCMAGLLCGIAVSGLVYVLASRARDRAPDL